MSKTNTFLSIAIGVLILDLFGYIFHVASHKIEFLWRFHEIHHLDEILDVSTSLRVHFMESFFHIIINFLAIYIFDIGKEAVAIHGLLGFMLAMYYHSNFKMPLNIEKIISIFFTTPKFHAPHHDRDIKNNQTNYSSIFTLWDKLFSTYNKSTFAKSWDFGLSYSSDVSTLQSLIKPLGKNGGK